MFLVFSAALAAAPTPEQSPPRPSLAPRWQPAPTSVPDEHLRALGLVRRGDGYQRIRNPEDRFDAFIRSDGQVVFRVDPKVSVVIDGLCAFAICVGPKPPPKKTHKPRVHPQSRRIARVITTVAAESALAAATGVGPWGYGTPQQGPLVPHDPSRGRDPDPVPLLTGVGRYGSLPSPTPAMARFMDNTFEFRTRLAKLDAERSLNESNKALEIELATIWSNAELKPQAKRAAVLRLWADLDEGTSIRDAPLHAHAGLDQQRAEAQAARRDMILHSIRIHAPAGSPHAFTSHEIATVNARENTVPFCPYAARTCPQLRPVQAEQDTIGD